MFDRFSIFSIGISFILPINVMADNSLCSVCPSFSFSTLLAFSPFHWIFTHNILHSHSKSCSTGYCRMMCYSCHTENLKDKENYSKQKILMLFFSIFHNIKVTSPFCYFSVILAVELLPCPKFVVICNLLTITYNYCCNELWILCFEFKEFYLTSKVNWMVSYICIVLNLLVIWISWSLHSLFSNCVVNQWPQSTYGIMNVNVTFFACFRPRAQV